MRQSVCHAPFRVFLDPGDVSIDGQAAVSIKASSYAKEEHVNACDYLCCRSTGRIYSISKTHCFIFRRR